MKKYFKVLLVLVMFIAMPVFAFSQDLFRSDDTVNITEPIDGTSFIAGQSVDVDSKVNGILFAAGNTVTTAGESDYAFVAGNIVKLQDEAFKDGYAAGSSVELNNVTVERDMFIAGQTITFDGVVGRNMYAGGSNITINGKVNGNLTVYGESITIGDNAVITGTLKYDDEAKITISDGATIGNKVVEKSNKSNVKVYKPTFMSKVKDRLFSLVNILVIGLLMMLLFPKLFENISKMDEKTILPNLGFGFLTLIAVPIACIFAMITIVGLSTGLVLLDLYIVFLYLSTVLTSYYLSNMFLSKNIKNKYLLFLIGAVALTILKLIPFIGTITSMCALFIGLGIVVRLIFVRK